MTSEERISLCSSVPSVVKSLIGMNLKISAALFAALLAAVGSSCARSKPNPIEAARHNNLGSAYMNQQLFEKGLKEFQQALAADPKFAIARVNEGVAYLNLQKVDEAKAALEDALKQDPKNPNAWYSLGLLAKNTGDAQAAIDAFKHVTEIDPNDADTWYFLGTAYVQAKQFPQAIDAFEHALKINPLHASAEFGLSRAYQQSSDTDHAREHLKRFQYITQNKIGSPMSLAYGEQGQYSRAVESPQAQLKPPPQIKVQFVDVTKEAGLVSKLSTRRLVEVARFVGPGACFLDYDNDGQIDLFLADNGPQGGMCALPQSWQWKFEDVTQKAGLDPEVHASDARLATTTTTVSPTWRYCRLEHVFFFTTKKMEHSRMSRSRRQFSDGKCTVGLDASSTTITTAIWICTITRSTM